jgi:hypothetical protein
MCMVRPVDALAGPGPCNGTNQGTFIAFAFANYWTAGDHTGCTAGVPSGAATACNASTGGTFNQNKFFAFWPSQTARVGDLTGGCIFNCSFGTCRVGNDGLPVELVQFGAE